MKKNVLIFLTVLFGEIAFSQIPTISSFTPASGPAGTTVTISGSNFHSFADSNSVFFGAARAIVTGGSSSSLTVVVPAGATYEPVIVLNNKTGLLAHSEKPFISIFTCSGPIDAGSYTSKVDFSTGGGTQRSIICDLDGDGKNDVIAATSSILLYRNTSSVNHFSFVQTSVTLSSNALVVGDVDGDGKPDIVAARSNEVSVLRNTSTPGAISFAAALDFTSSTGANVCIKDMNADGKPELIITNNSLSNVSVLKNLSTIGTISFSSKVDFTTGTGPLGLDIEDLDGDLKPDIAVTNSSVGTVSVLRNTSNSSTISFAAKVDLTAGTAPRSVAISDLNGDGKSDLVVVNVNSNNISVFKNTGSIGIISFDPKSDYASGISPRHVAVHDMNGDGKPDIAVANATGNSISLYENTSSGSTISLAANVDHPVGFAFGFLSIGDLDGDARPDIVSSGPVNFSVFRNQLNLPKVVSFTPTSIAPGATITITGSNFTGATAVTFGTKPVSSFTVGSSTTITAEAGLGRTGDVEVTTPCGLGGIPGLTVLSPAPVITSFSPISGPAGTTVTISGINFNPIASKNIVYFGAAKATVTGATATSLTVIVPLGSTYHPITVLETVSELSAFSIHPFITTPSCSGSLSSSAFSPKIDFASALTPEHVVSSDLDADGKPDLVIVNRSTSTSARRVSVHRNTSNIASVSFDPRIEYTAGLDPIFVAVGDLDGDGKPDLVVANNGTTTISVFKNNSTPGSISFSSKMDFTAGNSPRNIAIGDINGDGKADIVTSNFLGNSVSVLRNTGVGSIEFAAKVDFTTLNSPRGISIGDIDGDAKSDIVVAIGSSGTSHFSILRNTSSAASITFAPRIDYTTIAYLNDLCLGDLDGDGKLDVVVAPTTNVISVFRNLSTIGNVSFDNSLDLETAIVNADGHRVSITDFDGDAKPEIVAILPGVSKVILYKNNSNSGTLSFDPRIELQGTYVDGLAIADIDLDGSYDITVLSSVTSLFSIFRYALSSAPAVMHFIPQNGSPGTVITITGANFTGVTEVYFAGIPAASFTVVNTTTITAEVSTATLGLTGNVTVVTASCGPASQTGFSSFVIPHISSFSPEAGTVGTTVTISGNNFNTSHLDNTVFFGATQASITAGSSTSLTVIVPAGATYQPITVLDNSTGLIAYSDKPFISTHSCGGSNLEAGSFDPKVDFTTGDQPVSISMADLDKDGKPDLAIADFLSNTISILRNNSSAGILAFDPKVDLPTSDQVHRLVAGDLDGDGLLDLVVSNWIDNSLSILKNTSSSGVISFASKIDFTTSDNPKEITIGDLDLDGKPELVVGNYNSGTISIYKNTSSAGTVSFAAKIDLTTLAYPERISIADFDGDGKPDLALTNRPNSNTVSIFRNTSNVNLLSFAPYENFATGVQPEGIASGDMDGDGKPDLVIANNSSDNISVLRNTSSIGIISFAAKVDFPAGEYPGRVALGDLDGDGRPDMVVSNSSSSSVFKNTGTPGVIAFSSSIALISASPLQGSAFIGDLDGDNKSDIVITSPSTDVVSFFRNTVSNAASPIVSDINYCQDDIAGSLMASGTSLLWYTAAVGGVGSAVAPTPSTETAGTTSYYVSQTVSGCEGKRALMNVLVKTLPSDPTVVTPITYCMNSDAAPLTATGTSLLWYTDPFTGIGEAVITPNTSMAGTVSYFVSQTINGCEGSRAQLDVITLSTPVPSAPSVSTPLTYLQNETAVPLSATGTNLLWYTDAIGGVGTSIAPTPSTANTGTTSYYVSQTVSGCESSRALINVVVELSTSLGKTMNAVSLSVYPNPAIDIITIETNRSFPLSSYSIIAPTGKKVMTGKLTDQKTILNTGALPTGVYMLQVEEQYLPLIIVK